LPAVLHDISLRIQANEHVAVVGENGAGKSTLIKLITGIYEPTEGEVLLDNEPLREFDISSWHRQLAVLKQDFTRYLFASAHDNIAFGDVSKHDEKELDNALIAAEAKTFIEKLPRGLESYLYNWMEDSEGNKGVEISGGQWQRVALARNFYRDAPIIILDEPTSAIDALAETRIFERLFKHRDKTIITVSHRLTTVKKADMIYMMEDGRIVEQGNYAELLEKRGEFYKMFEAQL
jgi:ATP-binding cassette subfamily B protein/ATP-binding cassette subfamily C protein